VNWSYHGVIFGAFRRRSDGLLFGIRWGVFAYLASN